MISFMSATTVTNFQGDIKYTGEGWEKFAVLGRNGHLSKSMSYMEVACDSVCLFTDWFHYWSTLITIVAVLHWCGESRQRSHLPRQRRQSRSSDACVQSGSRVALGVGQRRRHRPGACVKLYVFYLPFYFSLRFNGNFPGGPELAGTRMSPLWWWWWWWQLEL